MNVLSIKNLSKHYGKTEALKNVNLDISSGKIIGLLGPNGCGKSTLFKIISGLLVPDSGEIRVCNHPVGTESKKITSFLPDRTYLPKWMKIRDCLSLFQDFYEDFDENKARHILESLGLKEKQTAGSLSKGNLEKLHLTLSLSRNAKLYLLDEPIGGVDPAARDYILKMIVQNYVKDSTMMISTHLVADIEKIFDEVVFLDSGEVKMQGAVDELREEKGKSLDQIFRVVYYVG